MTVMKLIMIDLDRTGSTATTYYDQFASERQPRLELDLTVRTQSSTNTGQNELPIK